MTRLSSDAPLLVVGAGIMGAGIAQTAAQAGHPVLLFDARATAAAAAREGIAAAFDTLVGKGRLSAAQAQAAVSRITPIATLQEAAGVALAIEVIVEQLDAKRALLRQLEDIVEPDCVLASNTSSISVTALANGLARPARLVGMHFFNPVPVMKLVEVISGLHTDPAVADAVFVLAERWGKVPVHARSTPGFIVNRIARPFYAEALALLQERAATPAVLDACLRGAGFRMGPCELMDLIGHDTNFAVTESVYAANFGDKRYQPSLVQKELVDGGWLGRKTGRGFYEYRGGVPVCESSVDERPGIDDMVADEAASSTMPGLGHAALVLHGESPWMARWADALHATGHTVERRPESPWTGVQIGAAQLRLTDGRPAGQVAAETGVRDLALFDLPLAALASGNTDVPVVLAWAAAPTAGAAWLAAVPLLLRTVGTLPQRIEDAAGLVVARTIAMLVNEAAEAVHTGVCTADGADVAMKLGVNYPAGPFEWLAAWQAQAVIRMLDHLDDFYRGERYRVSPYVRRLAWRGEGAA